MILVAVAACSAGQPRADADADAASSSSSSSSSDVSSSTGGETSTGGMVTGTDVSSDGSTSVNTSGSTGEPCTDAVPGPPAASAYPFMLGGQAAWSHDDGFSAGWFHTYDALDVGGPADLPHKVHVLLPRDYDACGPGYPVVYMNDGDTSFWPGGAGNKTWDVAGGLAGLYQAATIAPVIVVAIVPNDREYEYSHTPGQLDAACCGVEQYTAYVADHVRGFVDEHYNTRVERNSTAIIGSSRGGLAAFYLANRRPEVFGRAGCLSSSFWFGLDPVYGGEFPGGPLASSVLVQTLAGVLADPRMRPRLWIDWGLVRSGGFHNESIEAAATERGIEMVALLTDAYGYQADELYWFEDPIGEHDENSWARRFPAVMTALFAAP